MYFLDEHLINTQLQCSIKKKQPCHCYGYKLLNNKNVLCNDLHLINDSSSIMPMKSWKNSQLI